MCVLCTLSAGYSFSTYHVHTAYPRAVNLSSKLALIGQYEKVNKQNPQSICDSSNDSPHTTSNHYLFTHTNAHTVQYKHCPSFDTMVWFRNTFRFGKRMWMHSHELSGWEYLEICSCQKIWKCYDTLVMTRFLWQRCLRGCKPQRLVVIGKWMNNALWIIRVKDSFGLETESFSAISLGDPVRSFQTWCKTFTCDIFKGSIDLDLLCKRRKSMCLCLIYWSEKQHHSLGSDRMESVLGRNWSQRIPWKPSLHLM